jgi:hypothetical protein
MTSQLVMYAVERRGLYHPDASLTRQLSSLLLQTTLQTFRTSGGRSRKGISEKSTNRKISAWTLQSAPAVSVYLYERHTKMRSGQMGPTLQYRER